MRAPGPLGLLALGLLAIPACSLIAADSLGYVRCTDDAPCDALSSAQRLDLDACVGWQCNEGYCRLVQRDGDRDMHVRAVCFADGAGDCNDDEPAIHPGMVEECDGLDQDCDYALDEDVASGMADERFEAVVPVPSDARLGASASLAEGVSFAFVDTSDAGRLETVASTARRDPYEPAPAFSPELVPSIGETSRGDRCVVGGTSRAIAIENPCTGDTDCTSGLVCRARPDGRRVCGTWAGLCTTNAECADDSLCNGAERCAPGEPGADPRGCVGSLLPECASTELCDDDAAACHPLVGCGIVELAAAPAEGDRWIAASISDHCPSGSLRLGLIERGGATLRTLGGTLRTPAFFAVDADADDCTGASRRSALGAAGIAIASLPRDDLSQALVAYRSSAGTEAGVEIIGAWLEEDVAGNAWVSVTGNGVPRALLGRATASSARPAVAAVESAGTSGYVVAYALAAGGVALHFVPALPLPAPNCPVGPPPTEVCVAEERVLVPATVTTPRATPPIGGVTSSTVGTDAVVGDVSVALGGSTSIDAELALAYATAAEVVLRIGTVDGGVFDLVTEYRIPARSATSVSIVRLGRGLSVPNPALIPEGGLVVAWRDAASTWVSRLRDGRPPSMPLAVGDPLDAPRAAYLDGRLVIVGARPGEIDIVPLTCPVTP